MTDTNKEPNKPYSVGDKGKQHWHGNGFITHSKNCDCDWRIKSKEKKV